MLIVLHTARGPSTLASDLEARAVKIASSRIASLRSWPKHTLVVRLQCIGHVSDLFDCFFAEWHAI